MKNEGGQLKLSFGMIFSIILIIIFMSFAFYGINMFLDLQKDMEIETFYENLQKDVDKLWRGSRGSNTITYNLPNEIKEVCFVDDEFENIYFLSKDNRNIGGTKINNIKNIEFCKKNIKGKIELTIKKDYSDILVTITE